MAAFETGKYRNLLLEAGYDEQEIKNRLDDMFNTMFYGPDDERIYFPAGDDMVLNISSSLFFISCSS